LIPFLRLSSNLVLPECGIQHDLRFIASVEL
jgi:hypothetical protein